MSNCDCEVTCASESQWSFIRAFDPDSPIGQVYQNCLVECDCECHKEKENDGDTVQ